MGKIKDIVREEAFNFIKEFYDSDQESIADRYYEKLGILPTKKTVNTSTIKDDLFGFIDKGMYGGKLKNTIPIYKNPTTLDNVGYNARGILLENGDFFVGKTAETLHNDLIDFLIMRGVLPKSVNKKYHFYLPEEYLCVIRDKSNKIFIPADNYIKIPQHYLNIIKIANTKNRRYRFIAKMGGGDVDEQIDMNRAYSYIPKDMDPNRVFGGGLDAGLNEKTKK